jgi:hypothetical protein
MIMQGGADEVAFEPCFDRTCENWVPGTQHIHMIQVWSVKEFATAELADLWRRRVAELPDGQVEGELTRE